MNKLLASIFLITASFTNAQAQEFNPCSAGWHDVWIDSFVCGGDSCYADMSLDKMRGVSVSAICGDRNYCEKWMRSTEYGEEIKVDKAAKVKLSRVYFEPAGEKMCRVNKIKLTN